MKWLSRMFQAGAFIGSSVVAALPAPIEVKTWPNVVAATAYAVALATVTAGSRPAVRWIVGTLIAAVLIGTASFLICIPRTIEVDGKRYIKGELQPTVREDMATRKISEEDYFRWSGKDSSKVWTRDSIAVNTTMV